MSRVIQPSVGKRLAFAKWARLQGLNRHSSATWNVGEDVDVPEALMAGAQVDGRPYEPEAPKRRTRKRKDTTEATPVVLDETPQDDPDDSDIQKEPNDTQEDD